MPSPERRGYEGLTDRIRAPALRAADPLAEGEHPVGILLVDDNRENLVALTAVLEPLGEQLLTATSGEEALRTLLRKEIAVILLDVRMAGLDGLQTARIIRERPRTRRIPIIFLTAHASEIDEIALAYATGAVDYVIKPFEPEILRAKVSVFVELSRERSERLRQSRARADAEAVARTVRTLQILSDAVLAHMELDGLVAELLDRASTLFQADAGCLLLRDETTPGLVVHASRGAALPVPGGRVTLGQGVLGELAAERRAALVQGPELSSLYAEAPSQGAEVGVPIRTLLAVPLMAADELLGMLLLGACSDERFDRGEVGLLALAADRMAIAIDHVQRFAHGRQLLETLQRSLLPDRLPHHPRLRLAARYLPSGLAPQIGGDWYDALELDSDRTAITIGDVVGHGIRAATTMSELRNGLRAFALEGHAPAATLQKLGRVVHATLGPGVIATVLIVIIDAAEETVTIASAGHPSPALRGADGRVRLLDSEPSLPIGVDASVAPGETRHPLKPGETLLLFTDGLVERRRESLTEGLQRLSEAFAAAPGDVDEICEHVVQRMVTEEAPDDDVALLAVKLLAPEVGPLKLTLPASADSVPVARHRLRAWLDTNAPVLDGMARTELEVAWSEACTNAIRHAYGPRAATFEASADVDRAAVSLQIRDHGHWRPPRGRHGGLGMTVMRQLSDELKVDHDSRGTTVTIRRLHRSAAHDAGGSIQ